MKKIFTILFLFGMTLAGTAQYGYPTNQRTKKQFTAPDHNTSRNAFEQTVKYDKRPAGYGYYGNNQQVQVNNNRSGAEQFNEHGGQRAGYAGYHHAIDARDRDKKIYEQNSNRQQQAHFTGKVIVAGAVAGILAAALFSH